MPPRELLLRKQVAKGLAPSNCIRRQARPVGARPAPAMCLQQRAQTCQMRCLHEQSTNVLNERPKRPKALTLRQLSDLNLISKLRVNRNHNMLGDRTSPSCAHPSAATSVLPTAAVGPAHATGWPPEAHPGPDQWAARHTASRLSAPDHAAAIRFLVTRLGVSSTPQKSLDWALPYCFVNRHVLLCQGKHKNSLTSH